MKNSIKIFLLFFEIDLQNASILVIMTITENSGNIECNMCMNCYENVTEFQNSM